MLKKTAFLQPFCLASLLGSGFCVVIIIVVSWIVSLKREEPVPTDFNKKDERFVVLRDGTPIIQLSTYVGTDENGEWQKKAKDNPAILLDENQGLYTAITDRTIDGKPIDAMENGHPRNFDVQLSGGFGARPKVPAKEHSVPMEDRLRALAPLDLSPTAWYFIREKQSDERGYFVGYDTETKRCIGYVTKKGRSIDLPDRENWFLLDGRFLGSFSGSDSALIPHCVQDNYYPYERTSRFFKNVAIGQDTNWIAGKIVPKSEVFLISDDKALEINFEKGTIKPFFQAPKLESACVLLCEVSDINPLDPHKGLGLYYWIFRSSDRIYLLNEAKNKVGEFAIPEKYRNKGFEVHWIENEPKQLLLFTFKIREGRTCRYLDWIDTEGKILRHKEITLVQDAQAKNKEPPKCDWLTNCAFPVPVGVFVVPPFSHGPNYDETGEQEETRYWETVQKYCLLNWPAILMVCIASAILGFFCYRRQRRYALPWTWAWVGFVFLFGVPGFLGYRFHRRWSVLDACPTCKKKVPHDRENCSACGKSFPLPERKGIEIFA